MGYKSRKCHGELDRGLDKTKLWAKVGWGWGIGHPWQNGKKDWGGAIRPWEKSFTGGWVQDISSMILPTANLCEIFPQWNIIKRGLFCSVYEQLGLQEEIRARSAKYAEFRGLGLCCSSTRESSEQLLVLLWKLVMETCWYLEGSLRSPSLTHANALFVGVRRLRLVRVSPAHPLQDFCLTLHPYYPVWQP